MSIKARRFFKNLKNILQKVEEKVQNNYKDQFTEPQNHYCLLESINFEFDGPWEEFDNFILDTHWRYGREFINDDGKKDVDQDTIHIYISIKSLLSTKDVYTYLVGYIQGCIDSKEISD